jgi:hypothetical protein
MMAMSPAPRGGTRILAQLEHGTRPVAKPVGVSSWSIDGWTVGLCVLLLLMCSVAWMMHKKTITPESFKYSESRSRPAVTMARPASSMARPEHQQPATIVNEASATGTPPDQAVERPATPLSTTIGTPRGAHAAQSPPQQAATRRNAGSAEAQPAPSTHDTDVTLLTALVAHANKPTVTVLERSRDVVERQEGDSTAQLLARCQQLGLIEGMLCRSRICSGRWEADPACRAPAR